MSDNKLYYKLARTITKAGGMPMPINNALIELLQALINEERAKFIVKTFKKPSLSIDQIKAKTDLDEKALEEMLNGLMNNGTIVGLPSRRTGIMVYRLLPLWPGMFEYTFLKKISHTEREKKIARMFENLFEEMINATQNNYDEMVKQYEKMMRPITRIVPVEEEIGELEAPVEEIIPIEQVTKIVDKFDKIALSYCYCRQQKDLIGNPCKLTDERQNCFLLGKSAKFSIDHGFGLEVSKEKAKEIMKKAEDEGLVHKVFHIHTNHELDEEAICNCCKCCCGPSQMWINGIIPLYSLSHYLANVNDGICVGCGTCIDLCQVGAIELINTLAVINHDRCYGCGICAHHCPEKAITLERTELRGVYIPPPRIKQN